MVGQMSSKSKTYHRNGCKYVNRIEEKALITFDFDDGRINKLNPCKCCCNIKKIYENNKAYAEKKLKKFNIATKCDDECVNISTAWYNWIIRLNAKNQNLELYLEQKNEESDSVELIKCKALEETKKFSSVVKYIVNEEKLAPYPIQYRSQAIQIEKFAKQNNVEIEFDGTDLYILTDVAAWKIAYGYHYRWFKLLHCPFNGKPLTMEEAKIAHYHVQKDVSKSQGPYGHLEYIVKHDWAKKIEQIDYKNLPQRTRKQKLYYRQAAKRARRQSIVRVFDLFAEIEGKTELTGGVR